jgi:hypothetical protein
VIHVLWGRDGLVCLLRHEPQAITEVAQATITARAHRAWQLRERREWGKAASQILAATQRVREVGVSDADTRRSACDRAKHSAGLPTDGGATRGLGSTSPAPFLSLVEAVELGEIRSWLSSRPPQERLAALLGDLVNLGERVRLRRSRLPSGRCNPLARKRPLERARRLHAAVPCLLPQSPPDRLEAELAEFRQAPSSPFSSQRREVLPGRGHGPRPRVRQRLARSEEPDKACRPERSMKPHWPLGYLAEAASLQGKRLWGPGSAPFGAAMDSSAFIGKAVLTIESRPTIGRRAATVSPTCARS